MTIIDFFTAGGVFAFSGGVVYLNRKVGEFFFDWSMAKRRIADLQERVKKLEVQLSETATC